MKKTVILTGFFVTLRYVTLRYVTLRYVTLLTQSVEEYKL